MFAHQHPLGVFQFSGRDFDFVNRRNQINSAKQFFPHMTLAYGIACVRVLLEAIGQQWEDFDVFNA